MENADLEAFVSAMPDPVFVKDFEGRDVAMAMEQRKREAKRRARKNVPCARCRRPGRATNEAGGGGGGGGGGESKSRAHVSRRAATAARMHASSTQEEADMVVVCHSPEADGEEDGGMLIHPVNCPHRRAGWIEVGLWDVPLHMAQRRCCYFVDEGASASSSSSSSSSSSGGSVDSALSIVVAEKGGSVGGAAPTAEQ